MTPSRAAVRRFRRVACAALGLAAIGTASIAADSAKAPWTRHPGFVSGEPFTALASDHGELVEVSVTGALLGLVASTVRAHDAELASMIESLAAVSAVIVEIEQESVGALDRAERALVERMDSSGWNAIARVRDGSTRVTVWVLPRGESFEGLTVLVRDGRDIVFTNIAGTIDLQRLHGLAGRLNVPGLDEALRGDLLRDAQPGQENRSVE